MYNGASLTHPLADRYTTTHPTQLVASSSLLGVPGVNAKPKLYAKQAKILLQHLFLALYCNV